MRGANRAWVVLRCAVTFRAWGGDAVRAVRPGRMRAASGTGAPSLWGEHHGVGDACDNCPNEPALIDPDEPGTEVTCNDGIDNDCDGDTDAADADCP